MAALSNKDRLNKTIIILCSNLSSQCLYRKCTSLWGEPDWVHTQNMEPLTVIRMWLNLRPQKITKYTHVYTGTVSRAWLQYTSMLHTGWSGTGCRSWRWHGQMTALEPSSFTCAIAATGCLYRAIVWSPLTNTGTVSQATKTNRIDRLPCSYDIALATE